MVDEERVVERQSVTTPPENTAPAETTPPADTAPAETTPPADTAPAETAPYVEPVRYASEPVTNSSVVTETVRRSPSGAEVARRAIVFIFGLIQALIVIRIVLLLADANQTNQLVRFIYDTSSFFVGPFEGILNTNAVQAGASIFDIAALVALIGWTILEILIIALIGIARREP